MHGVGAQEQGSRKYSQKAPPNRHVVLTPEAVVDTQRRGLGLLGVARWARLRPSPVVKVTLEIPYRVALVGILS